jgi:eukaryotic-like serine/threonine-protein kinase
VFDFIKSKYLWYQVALAIVVSLLLIWLLLISLGWLTDHGKAINVPVIKGLPLNKARALLDSRGLDVVIMDSTFVLGTKPGMILEQDPKSGTPVKPGRKIYVSIQVFSPPYIKMPNVKDASLRQAMLILKSNSLNFGKVIYKPDYASNAVLYAELNGVQIETGGKLRKGSYVNLIVANGLGSEEMPVPSLIGLTLEEARLVLTENHITIGALIYDSDAMTDSTTAFIYRQTPDVYDELDNPSMIHMGQSIDIWLTLNSDKIKLDSLRSIHPKGGEGSTFDNQ